MNPSNPYYEILRRQRALWLIAAGLLTLLLLLAAGNLWPGLPLPDWLHYLPLIPAIILFAGIWIYPAGYLTTLRKKVRFHLRLYVMLALLFSPFSAWLKLFPEKHYFQVCTTLGILAAVLTMFHLSSFLAMTAPWGSARRLFANYIRISLFILLLIPSAFLFIRTVGDPAYFHTFTGMLSAPWQILVLHPVFFLIGLLIYWPVGSDTDLTSQTDQENQEKTS